MSSREDADRSVAEAFGRTTAQAASFAAQDRALAGTFGREPQADTQFRQALMEAGLSEVGARMLVRDLEDGFDAHEAVAMASRFTAKPNGVPAAVAAQVRPLVEARTAPPTAHELAERLRAGLEQVNEVERLRNRLKEGQLSHLFENGRGDGAERAAERFADELVQAAESRAARFGWGKQAVAEDLQATLTSHVNKWARIREARLGATSESDAAAAVAEAFGRTPTATTSGLQASDVDELARRQELKDEGWTW